MDAIRITKCFTFDMAHALKGYDGLCRNIHGHTYFLRVTLIGKIKHEEDHPKNGFVMDFGILKDIIKREVIDVYDHSLILRNHLSETEISVLKGISERIHYVDFQPTCENLLIHIKNKMIAYLPEYVALHSLRLDETPTSYAEWFLSDQ